MIQLNLIPMKYPEAVQVVESMMDEAELLAAHGYPQDAVRVLEEAREIAPGSETRWYLNQWINNLLTFA